MSVAPASLKLVVSELLEGIKQFVELIHIGVETFIEHLANSQILLFA
jgi:hypothetical protein